MAEFLRAPVTMYDVLLVAWVVACDYFLVHRIGLWTGLIMAFGWLVLSLLRGSASAGESG